MLRQAGHRASSHTSKLTLPAAALPDWVEVGHRLCYVSKTNSNVSHHVQVKKIEERRQTVLVTFEMDKKIWKRVPFSEISRMGDGSLRPLWKPEPSVATVPKKPTDFKKAEGVEDEAEVVSVSQAPTVEGPKSGDDEKDVVAVDGPPKEAESPAPHAATPALTSQAAGDDSEEEREQQMARRMRRVQRQSREQALRSRSRTPKKKSHCYVPGHMV